MFDVTKFQDIKSFWCSYKVNKDKGSKTIDRFDDIKSFRSFHVFMKIVRRNIGEIPLGYTSTTDCKAKLHDPKHLFLAIPINFSLHVILKIRLSMRPS